MIEWAKRAKMGKVMLVVLTYANLITKYKSYYMQMLVARQGEVILLLSLLPPPVNPYEIT